MNPELRLVVDWEPRWRGFITSVRPALARTPHYTYSRLTVNWERRWPAFVSSVRPALTRSDKPLDAECPAGLFSRHGIGLSLAGHVGVIVLLACLSARVLRRPDLSLQQAAKRYDVIYYSGDLLPQTEDSGGAEAGREGRTGGSQAQHAMQVMHIAREQALTDVVTDAPTLLFPRSETPANLLAVAPAEPLPAAVEPERALSRLPAVPVTVVPPPPAVERNRMAALPQADTRVVEPAPAVPHRKLADIARPDVEVVPPSVAVPARETATNAKLELPQTVVEPPPAEVARDVRARIASTSEPAVVPPPPAPEQRQTTTRLRPGFGELPSVAPPAPAASTAELRRTAEQRTIVSKVAVAPPPAGPSTEDVQRAAGRAFRRSSGLNKSAVVVSLAPGVRLGVPSHARTGTLAMSPDGNGKNGPGGSGDGSGTGAGSGTGRAAKAMGPGATVAGTGRGTDPLAHGGTSPSSGRGGSGLGGDTSGGISGVTVRGGLVTLPDFAGAGGAAGPDFPATASVPDGPRVGPAITIVATARSGGALAAYGALRGAKVYTIYLDTRFGPAVLEYAEHGVRSEFERDLTAPQAVETSLPAALAQARFVVACVIDRSGFLKDFRILDNAGGESAAILAAIHQWRFRPVLRGEQAVEVDAIVGFGVGTN